MRRLTAARFLVVLVSAKEGLTQSPATVTLTPTTSPAAGQPGVTSISVTGSNFPAGTINAASVTVSLQPASGGAKVNAVAAAIATVTGTTRRVSFTIPNTIVVATATPYSVSLSGQTTAGTAFSSSNTSALTVNPGPSLSSITPASGSPGQSLQVTITGTLTNFVQGSTTATFGAGISVGGAAAGAAGPVTVTSATTATAQIAISGGALVGPRSVTLQTGVQQAVKASGFSVAPGPPQISDFNPKSAAPGATVTVVGTNLASLPSVAPTVSLSQQGGGTVAAQILSANASSITFVVPAGTVTGPVSVAAGGQTVSSSVPLVIDASAVFSLQVNPGAVGLIRGQSAAVSTAVTAAAAFTSPVQLSVAGLPSGITASFKPPSVTAGQVSVLTLNAPAGQALGGSTLTVTASAVVNGVPLTQSATTLLTVKAPTTSFIGRTVVSDAAETPLAGVTVTMQGKDGNGGTTGCSGTAVSDAAGNFAMLNLPSSCVGPQLIGYDGTTATSPAGKYAGVNLVYTFSLGQVTASGPRPSSAYRQ